MIIILSKNLINKSLRTISKNYQKQIAVKNNAESNAMLLSNKGLAEQCSNIFMIFITCLLNAFILFPILLLVTTDTRNTAVVEEQDPN